MKLTSVTVQSFRGFGRREDFSLGDVNVLGGHNGFGKTSFFDAVLWCLFGEIPRLAGTRDFVQAGDICQNKFSKTKYVVALTFDTPNGKLSISRNAHRTSATLGGREISGTSSLEMLNLAEGDAINRFLRNFLLEQDTINAFVRALNPRNRYDSLTSVLRFRTPNTLGTRLDVLTSVLDRRLADLSQELKGSQERLSLIKSRAERLQQIGKTISYDVAQQRYDVLLRKAGEPLLTRLGYEPAKQDGRALRERLVSLTACTANALSELEDWSRRLGQLKRLRTSTAVASDLASLNEQVADQEAELADISLRQLEIESQLSQCAEKVALQQARIDALSEAHGRVNRILAQVQGIVMTDSCPVCQRPMDRSQLMGIITAQMGASQAELAPEVQELEWQAALRRSLEARSTQSLAAKEQRQAAIRALTSAREDRRKLEEAFEGLIKSAAAVRWQFQLSNITSPIPDVQDTFDAVREVHHSALELARTIDDLVAATALSEELHAQDEAEGTVAKLRVSVAEATAGIGTLQKCRDAISSAEISLTESTLDSYKPLIRALYKRMHPHRLFTDIDFDVTQTAYGGELYFKVVTSQRSTEAYPSTIFSASQINALAVSVFLAMNLRAEPPLSLAMLDDPIHSLDDVNVLGFCDLLRQIKSKRQIFISTHNPDLYGLLLNKLRPSNPVERVVGFWFEDWSAAGPTIRQDTREYVSDNVQPTLIAEMLA